jgi:hypothetical protein
VARACLEGAPRDDTPQALAAFGVAAADIAHLTAAAAPPPTVDVWPDHTTPLLIFRALLTQWRMGPSGPIGLDYTVRPLVASDLRLRPRALREAWPAVQAMEAEALQWFAEQREQAERRSR